MQNKILKLFLSIIISFGIFAMAGKIQAANYPLEIINIDEVGENNRIKFAYPGIEYKVVIAAEGGTYPFTWELLQAPTGMTINTLTGEITWSNPINGGLVEVKVTDAESNIDTESYAVVVTSSTDRFLFVDAMGGSSVGLGTINDPFQKLDDFWLSDHTGKIVYLRSGTYTYPKNGNFDIRHINRIDIASTNPLSYIGYPGEIAVLNGEQNYCWKIDETDNYFHNLVFDNIKFYGMAVVGDGDYLTVYDCAFQNTYSDEESHNQSSINFMAGPDHEKLVIFGNTFGEHRAGSNYCAIETYDVLHSVIQENVFNDTGKTGLFFKGTSENCFVRRNVFNGPTIPFYGGLELYGGSGHHDMDVSFNLFKNDEKLFITTNQPIPVTDVYIYRNTFVNASISFRNDDGEINFIDDAINIYNNVLQNILIDSGLPPGDTIHNHMEFDNVLFAEYSSLQNGMIDNITGASDMVDSDGNFTEAYLEYIGTHGWQTESGDIIAPNSPINLQVL